jgi:hypothetical protein
MIVRSVRGKNIPLRNMSYQVVRGIYARALLAAITDGDAFTNNMLESIARAVKRCMIKISRDLDTIGDMIAASNVPAGPEYDIFTLTQAAGDEIFASKKVRATGLLVSH